MKPEKTQRGKTDGERCFLRQQFAIPAGIGLVLLAVGTAGWVSVTHMSSAAVTANLPTATVLGVEVVNPTEVIARTFAFPPGRGVLITKVFGNGPGWRAGLREGDAIVAMNARAIRSPQDLAQSLIGVESGDFLRLTVLRGGLAHDLVLPVRFSMSKGTMG